MDRRRRDRDGTGAVFATWLTIIGAGLGVMIIIPLTGR